MMQPSIPGGAEQDAAARIERSFLVLRIVRGAVLLLFWAVALVAVTVGHWPTGAAIVVLLAGAAQAALLARSCRRLLGARDHRRTR